MSRRKHRPSPEPHRFIRDDEHSLRAERARRYAVRTNLLMVNKLMGAFSAAEEQGLLDEETTTALRSWEEKNLGTVVVGELVEKQITLQRGVVGELIRTPTEDILYHSFAIGEAALELLGIAPIAFLNDVIANTAVE